MVELLKTALKWKTETPEGAECFPSLIYVFPFESVRYNKINRALTARRYLILPSPWKKDICFDYHLTWPSFYRLVMSAISLQSMLYIYIYILIIYYHIYHIFLIFVKVSRFGVRAQLFNHKGRVLSLQSNALDDIICLRSTVYTLSRRRDLCWYWSNISCTFYKYYTLLWDKYCDDINIIFSAAWALSAALIGRRGLCLLFNK